MILTGRGRWEAALATNEYNIGEGGGLAAPDLLQGAMIRTINPLGAAPEGLIVWITAACKRSGAARQQGAVMYTVLSIF